LDLQEARAEGDEGLTFRGVLFDLDGTLIDSYRAIDESLNAVLAAFGRPAVQMAETRRMVGHGLETLIRQAVGPENVAEGVRIFRASYTETGPRGTSLLPGAEAVSRALSARGMKLGIASNKPSYFSRQLVDQLGIGELFPRIAGPDLGFPAKPDPAMVLDLLRGLGLSAEETLFVGDMEVDIETARAAGLRVAVIPTGSSSREELVEARPDHLLERLEELLDIVA